MLVPNVKKDSRAMDHCYGTMKPNIDLMACAKRLNAAYAVQSFELNIIFRFIIIAHIKIANIQN